MRLNHLDLPVPDVAAARAFFVDLLDFSVLRAGDDFALLRDEAGFVLALSRRRDGETLPHGLHVGFLLPDEAQVSALYQRLAAAGWAPAAPARQYGAFAFYFTGPGEIMIEVAHRG